MAPYPRRIQRLCADETGGTNGEPTGRLPRARLGGDASCRVGQALADDTREGSDGSVGIVAAERQAVVVPELELGEVAALLLLLLLAALAAG